MNKKDIRKLVSLIRRHIAPCSLNTTLNEEIEVEFEYVELTLKHMLWLSKELGTDNLHVDIDETSHYSGRGSFESRQLFVIATLTNNEAKNLLERLQGE